MKDKVTKRRKVQKKKFVISSNGFNFFLFLLLILFIIMFINKVIRNNKEADIYNSELDKDLLVEVNSNVNVSDNSSSSNNDELIKENKKEDDNIKINETSTSSNNIKPNNNAKPNNNVKPNNNAKPNNNVKPSNNVKPNENIKPTYIQGILIANKTYKLPSTYNPGLQKAAKDAFDKMKIDASKDGITLWILSGFRSYKTQENLYNRYVRTYGKKASDTFSARPGHSEHQTGLAMDINSLDDNFGNTKEGKWLSKNAHKYGFILRYPKGKEHITGYKYEPWHFRYLGVDIATKVYNKGVTLEEYLGITSKYKE